MKFYIELFKRRNIKDYILKFKKILFRIIIKGIIKSRDLSYFYGESYIEKALKKKKVNDEKFSFNSYIFNIINSGFNIKKSSNTIYTDQIRSSVLKYADDYCDHTFNLLNLNYKEFSKKDKKKFSKSEILEDNRIKDLLDSNYKLISWAYDYKAEYEWDINGFFTKMRAVPRGVDIKIPWELSRCQHFLILALAYHITKKEKYRKEIKNQIIDWIASNPFCHGPNWVCSMEVAIRIVNWLTALDIVGEFSESKNNKFLKIFLISLNHHFIFIKNNLEWTSRLTSNHYLSDLLGLLFICHYCPLFKDSAKILKYSVIEMEKEIFKQVNEDGMNFEGSTSYHRLVLELFLYPYIFFNKGETVFSENYKQQLLKMLKFSEALMMENGKIPQIGDNDNGVLFKFYIRDILNHKYLKSLGKIVFPEKFVFKDKYTTVEYEIFKEKEFEIFDFEEMNSVKDFKKSGITVFKDKNIYISVYNSLNGQKGNGGHAHNDRLSFTLNYKGRDIFVDPGTYTYTSFPEERNAFRSTYSHNTVMIEKYEQNRFIRGNLFSMREDIKRVFHECSYKNNIFRYSGNHNGYTRISEGLIHNRVLIYDKKKSEITIEDEFKDSKFDKFFLLMMNRNLNPLINGNEVFFDMGKITFLSNSTIKMEPAEYSRYYGKKENSLYRIIVSFKKSIKTVVKLEGK